MPGPPPTPTKILAARGSKLVKDRSGEPTVPVERPTCPEFLKGEAKAEWNRQVKLMEAAGMITKLDRGNLALYCEAWGEFVRQVKRQQELEAALKKATGKEVEQIEKSLWRLSGAKGRASMAMIKLSDRLGFNPSARVRVRAVGTTSKQEATGKDRFFGKIAEGT